MTRTGASYRFCANTRSAMASASAVIAGERAACTLGRAMGICACSRPGPTYRPSRRRPIPGKHEQGILNLATEAEGIPLRPALIEADFFVTAFAGDHIHGNHLGAIPGDLEGPGKGAPASRGVPAYPGRCASVTGLD